MVTQGHILYPFVAKIKQIMSRQTTFMSKKEVSESSIIEQFVNMLREVEQHPDG